MNLQNSESRGVTSEFWKDGARLALSFSLMFEADWQPISGAGGVIPEPITNELPDLPTNAFFAYGVYEGIPRLLDLMDKHDIKLSSFMMGPLAASKAFLAAVPDLKVTVEQQVLAVDRVVSHLRFTGHFTGIFKGVKGKGQPVNFIATDILRVADGKITDNWHIEDNLTFLQQIGFVSQ
jgi:predicted ester cyclase